MLPTTPSQQTPPQQVPREQTDNPPAASRVTSLLPGFGEYAGMLVILTLLVITFSAQNPRFFSWATINAVLNQIPALTLVSVAMTLVLITGAIDLSVGSVLALSASVTGVLMADYHWNLWQASMAALLVGGSCGLTTGFVSTRAAVPSFIVSLGVLQIARGAAYLVTDSQIKFVGIAAEPLARKIPAVGVSPAFAISLATVVVAQFVLSRTVFGRYCIATGTNESAVRMSGIDTLPVRITVFVISGTLAAAAGIIETSRIGAADPNGANGLELSAIAAAVIGGTSLMGGRGSVINTFLGVLMIAVLQTGLSQLGVDDGSKKIVTGTVIVLAVILDSSRDWLRQQASRLKRR